MVCMQIVLAYYATPILVLHLASFFCALPLLVLFLLKNFVVLDETTL